MERCFAVISQITKQILVCLSLVFVSFQAAAIVGFVDYVNYSSGIPTHCTSDTVITSDGQWVYSSAFCDGALNIFKKEEDGKLTLVQSLVNEDENGDTMEGVSPSNFLLISPDDSQLYVFGKTTEGDEGLRAAIFVFDIDADTGLLAQKQIFDDFSMSGSRVRAEITKDGKNIYLVSGLYLSVINRSANGILSLQLTSNVDNISTSDTRYYGTRDIIINNNDDRVYVSVNYNNLMTLSRDKNSGAVSFVSDSAFGESQTAISSLTISKDDKDIYAFTGSALMHYKPSTSQGLELISETKELPPEHNNSKFFCPDYPLVSDNGRLVYFVDHCSDDLQLWGRDEFTGELTFFGMQDESGDFPTRYFAQANNYRFSQDGQFLFGAVNDGVAVMDVSVNTNVEIKVVENALPGESLDAEVWVANNGVSYAHRVMVTVNVSGFSVGVEGITGNNTKCIAEGASVACSLFELVPGGAEKITLNLIAASEDTDASISATVDQDQLDFSSTDNTAVATTTISSSIGGSTGIGTDDSDTEDETDSESGGGSISWIALFMLLSLRIVRNQKVAIW